MSHEISFALKLNIYGQPIGTPFDVFVRLARQAEAVGFDGVYVVDHLFLPADRLTGYTTADPTRPFFLEAWTALAALAQATRRVRLGPQVSPTTFRHPAMLAKMGATVDQISYGRLVLQLGTGWYKEEHEAFGFPYEERFGRRFEAMVEAVEIVQGLWTAEAPFSYAGKHFQMQEAPFWPKPVQRPGPPIWFGGMGKKIRTAVARYGNGWCPTVLHHPEQMGFDAYAQALGEIRELAERFGRKADAITPGVMAMTAIHEERARAAELAGTLLGRSDFAHLSLDELRARGTLTWGNPDDCLRGLDAFIRAGARYFTLNFVPLADVDSAMRGMDLYASKVLPRLR